MGMHPKRRQRVVDKLYYYVQNGYCHLCHELMEIDEVTIDHIIPKIDGGKRTQDNILLAHAYCNSIRGSDDIREPEYYQAKRYEKIDRPNQFDARFIIYAKRNKPHLYQLG